MYDFRPQEELVQRLLEEARSHLAEKPRSPLKEDFHEARSDATSSQEGEVLLEYLNTKYQVEADGLFSSHRPVLGAFVVLLKRLLLPFVKLPLSHYIQRQNEFNYLIMQFGRWLKTNHEDDVRTWHEAIEGQRRENDKLLHQLGEKLHGLESSLEKEKYFEWAYRDHLRSLSRLLLARSEEKSTGDQRKALLDLRDDHEGRFSYLLFNRYFTGSLEELKEMFTPYLVHFQGRRRILEVGCGRGAFLQLLKEEGLVSYGLERDPEMLRHCRDLELDVRDEDALDHLRSLADGSLEGLFMAHVVEHLETTYLCRLFSLAFSKMAPGSPLVLETPNASSPWVLAHHYFKDPTHVLPRHPRTYCFFLEFFGFRVGRMEYIRPVLPMEEVEGPPQEDLRRMKEALFGHTDFYVVAYRP